MAKTFTVSMASTKAISSAVTIGRQKHAAHQSYKVVAIGAPTILATASLNGELVLQGYTGGTTCGTFRSIRTSAGTVLSVTTSSTANRLLTLNETTTRVLAGFKAWRFNLTTDGTTDMTVAHPHTFRVHAVYQPNP